MARVEADTHSNSHIPSCNGAHYDADPNAYRNRDRNCHHSCNGTRDRNAH